MRLAFFGTPAYAVPTLDALAASEHEVVTVVAQPDRPSGRGKKHNVGKGSRQISSVTLGEGMALKVEVFGLNNGSRYSKSLLKAFA